MRQSRANDGASMLTPQRESSATANSTLGRWAVRSLDHLSGIEFVIRLTSAALQVLATWAIVHALSPTSAGIYFRGYVIAFGMAALLRGNYELYVAYHIIGARSAVTGISNGALLMQLGRRVLLRSTLACGVLLVITADLDIQAPRLQPALETYLPFVLAIPFVSASTFIGEAFRAANRTLFGNVVAAYALNFSILLAVALAPTGSALPLYAWAFFGGSAIAAALAVVLAGRVLPASRAQGELPITREILRAADERNVIAVSRSLLLWGPICILVVAATSNQMAQYAVAVRTAMTVDFFLPALNLCGGRDLVGMTVAARVLLSAQLRGALLYSSTFVMVLLAAAPVTLRLYGNPYQAQPLIYLILLGAQWANSVGRPAVRSIVARWNVARIRAAVGSAAIAALTVCGLMIGTYGALAAAAGSLIGALLLNSWAVVTALREP